MDLELAQRITSTVSGQRSAVSGQRSAVSGQRSAVSGQRSAVGGQPYADQVGEGFDCLSEGVSVGNGKTSETDSSLDFARDCGYITAQQHRELTGLCQEVGKMLGSIINNPTSFLLSPPCPLPSAPAHVRLTGWLEWV